MTKGPVSWAWQHWKLTILLLSIPGFLAMFLLSSPSAALIDWPLYSIDWALWRVLTILIDIIGNPVGLPIFIITVIALVLAVRFIIRFTKRWKRPLSPFATKQAQARRHRWAVKEEKN